MTVAATTPLAELVSAQDAREELSKFFALAEIAEKAPEMFSPFIDAEWHRLMESKNDYSRFCMESVGHLIGHKEGSGYGVVSWVDLYHERFGTLPAAWFASTEGIVDMAAYGSYLDSTDFIKAWDCTPAPPDPDVKPKGKPGVITSWDCSPVPPDPDLVKTSPDVPIPPVPDEFAA